MKQNQTPDPAITLPQGGAALKAVGETFQADPLRGMGGHTVPVPTAPGRNGFGPGLNLQYSAGFGNGIFGLGWQLNIARVSRKTDKGLPTYDDSDTFVLSGAEDLVPSRTRIIDPVTNEAIWIPEEPDAHPPFRVSRFRPRVETLFARIERWEHETTGEVHWRTTTRENVTSIYGASARTRLADPNDSSRVFEWLLEETRDRYGNHILYEYAADHPDAASGPVFEEGRSPVQLYPRRILYGNLPEPLVDAAGDPVTYPDGTPAGFLRNGRRYAFEVAFDYGEWPFPTHDLHSAPADDGQELFLDVPLRPDPFSNFRSRFEIRTQRRCRRILMFHHFAELGGPTLVHSTDLDYETDPDTLLSLLTSITITRYRRQGAGGYRNASLPPLTFSYSAFRPSGQRYQSLRAEDGQLPQFHLGNPAMALVDMFGSGSVDILQADASGMRCWRNRGGGLFDAPRPLPDVPSVLTLDDPGLAFGDMAGDGRTDLLMHSGPRPGYFQSTGDGAWESFTPYENFPSFDLGDARLRLLDLTGDGLTDALLTTADHFIWFRCIGKRGFAGPQTVARRNNLDVFPDVSFDDPGGRVRLACMSGGLNDIVLIHDRRIEYWPNLGYGEFGNRIVMKDAPDLPPEVDPARLFLVDLNGTGCADLVYVEPNRLHFWFNQNGNSWSERQTISGTPPVSDSDALTFADVLGTGTATLVWSYDFASQPEGNYKALDFCGGVKPYTLTETSNSMGATTRVRYVSSTRHFLDDLANGTPWVSRLPFPVQVVDTVETTDDISGRKLVTRYRYHHGYFDGRDREFRGFGRVDQFDAEEFEDFAGRAGDAVHVPPVETRTWFNTGLYFDEGAAPDGAVATDARALSSQFRKEFYAGDATAVPLGDDVVEHDGTPQDAYRALAGAVLRLEVYGRDGSDRAPHPYEVTETRYRVSLLQPGSDTHPGVHSCHSVESLCYHYERNADDPRVVQTLTLDVDTFGNPLRTLAIAYGRRLPASELPADEDREAQARLTITCAEMAYTNAVDDPVGDDSSYRTPLPAEVRTFALTGFTPEAGRTQFTLEEWTANSSERIRSASEISYEESPSGTVEQKRLIDHVRTRYRADDFSALLPLGSLESLAIPGETRRLALTPGLVAGVYGDRVTDAMLLDDGGYVHEEGDGVESWWTVSARAFYSPDPSHSTSEELAFARSHFFLPHRHTDPFGHSAFVDYDTYSLFLTGTTDATGNRATADIDYRMLQSHRTVDANGNSAEVTFDTLGLVVATALLGKPSDASGDSLEGIEVDLTHQQVEDFLADPLSAAVGLLGSASTRVVYGVDRFRHTGQPSFAAILARETHVGSTAGTGDLRVQIRISYADGYGREIQSKALGEPDTATPQTPRWLTTGWKVYNNKGLVVRSHEPFFDDNPAFRAQHLEGVSSIFGYDPQGRVVVTLHPNHSWEKVRFDAWRQESWDVNDTSLIENPAEDPDAGAFFRQMPDDAYLPTWHAARAGGALGTGQKEAADCTAAHAGTPAIAHSDSLGRAFLSVAHNRFAEGGSTVEERYFTRTVLDVEGNTRETIDASARVVLQSDYDVLGTRIHDSGMDNGERWTLFDITGQSIFSWDSRGHRMRTAHDERRRPVAAFLRTGTSGPEVEVGRTVYGESVPDPETGNRRDKVVQVFDQSGVVTCEAYDFKGNLVASRRQLASEFRTLIDWSANPVLETEVFSSSAAFDALSRPVAVTSPDQSIYTPVYARDNRVTAVDVRLAGAAAATRFLNHVEYDARGQRQRVEFGNGVITRIEYDPLTLRLARLTTERGSERLQDLHYTHDAIGNVIAIEDRALQTVYFSNQVVEPRAGYLYDASYRLIAAEGREHIGQQSPLAPSWDDHSRVGLAHPNDGQAMRNYVERYSYDAVGNILDFIHQAANGDWTRTYTYDEPSLLDPAPRSNRLSATSVSGSDETYSYDAHGNMTGMAHLPAMVWNYRDALQRVERPNGTQVHFVYDANGVRIRKIVEHAGGSRLEERIYLGGFELFRRRENGALTLERQTLHVMDDAVRVAMVETRTEGSDPAPARLTRYQFGNHLGSAVLELDDAAAIVTYEEYYPYGSTSYQAVRSQTETRKRYRLTALERDEETGFSFHRARYYAPWLARWTSADPAGIGDGTNAYRYAGNNPVGFVDPSGTDKVQARLMTDDDMRAAGIQPPPQMPESDLKRPSREDPVVTINDLDAGKCEQSTLSQIRKSPDYIDNGLKSVGATRGDFWILEIDQLHFKYNNKPDIMVPIDTVDFGPAKAATEFIRSQGVIIPLDDEGFPAFNSENTPTIVRGAQIKLEDQSKAQTQFQQAAQTTFAFQMSLAQLGGAAAGMPEGSFEQAVLPPRVPVAPPVATTAGAARSVAAADVSAAGIVQRVEGHVATQNARVASAIRNGNREFFRNLNMSDKQINIIMRGRGRTYAAQYGNALERAVGRAMRSDPKLSGMIVDARYLRGRIFPSGPQMRLRPDFGFTSGPLQGTIVDLTTAGGRAAKMAKYHDRVLVLEYTRL
jgi:RHS repeat-associated protein